MQGAGLRVQDLGFTVEVGFGSCACCLRLGAAKHPFAGESLPRNISSLSLSLNPIPLRSPRSPILRDFRLNSLHKVRHEFCGPHSGRIILLGLYRDNWKRTWKLLFRGVGLSKFRV